MVRESVLMPVKHDSWLVTDRGCASVTFARDVIENFFIICLCVGYCIHRKTTKRKTPLAAQYMRTAVINQVYACRSIWSNNCTDFSVTKLLWFHNQLEHKLFGRNSPTTELGVATAPTVSSCSKNYAMIL